MNIQKFRVKRLFAAAVITVLFAVVFLSAQTVKERTDSASEDVQSEIAAFLEKWNSAIANGDTSAIRSAYTDDARFQWFEDGQLRYRSADEILDELKKFPAGTKIDTKLSELKVVKLSENLAYGSAVFSTKITMPTGNFEFSGVFTMLLRRSDARWKFISGHTSTAKPDSPPSSN